MHACADSIKTGHKETRFYYRNRILSDSRYGSVAGFCAHVNDPWVSAKRKEFLDEMANFSRSSVLLSLLCFF